MSRTDIKNGSDKRTLTAADIDEVLGRSETWDETEDGTRGGQGKTALDVGQTCARLMGYVVGFIVLSGGLWAIVTAINLIRGSK